MASRDSLGLLTALNAPVLWSGSPDLIRRNSIAVVVFPDTIASIVHFSTVMPNHYDDGDVIAVIGWLADTATTGNVLWRMAFARVADDADDLDTITFPSPAVVPVADRTTADVAGEIRYSEATLASANRDGVTRNEFFKIELDRSGDSGSDTLVGDAHMVCIELKEA